MSIDARYAIKNDEIETLLKQLALNISEHLPNGWGFNLMLFEFGEKGSLFYISDAQREDVIKVMKEWINRQVI